MSPTQPIPNREPRQGAKNGSKQDHWLMQPAPCIKYGFIPRSSPSDHGEIREREQAAEAFFRSLPGRALEIVLFCAGCEHAQERHYPMKITVLDDYQNAVRGMECFKKLAGHEVTIWNDHTKKVDVLAERLRDTQALVLIRERTPITEPLLARLKSLKIISHLGPYPHVDVDACTRHGVVFCSRMGGGAPSYATAEFTWGLVIAAIRNIPQEAAALKAGKWQAYPLGLGLRGKTLGVYAYGLIGGVVADYGKAFGMKVLAWGREASKTRARADGVEVASSREALFAESDVVSLHIPLIPETRGIVTADDLARMKPTALLVNTSRAGIIAPAALESALRAGRPGKAAVDVFEEEPAPPNYPLLAMDTVVCTPHLGYVESAQLEFILAICFDQILDYAAGQPTNVVNPAVLERHSG
jgi:D-3-phosphoglycerate dehydrogenase